MPASTALSAPGQSEKPLEPWIGPLTLTPEQKAVFDDSRRFRMVIRDRRWGKTTLGCIELLRGASEKVGHYFYLAPTMRMAKDIGWEKMLSVVSAGSKLVLQKSTLSLFLPNGSVIRFASSESGGVKGCSLRGIVLDDFDMYKKDVWTLFAAPSLSDLRGWALFLASKETGGLGPCSLPFCDLEKNAK